MTDEFFNINFLVITFKWLGPVSIFGYWSGSLLPRVSTYCYGWSRRIAGIILKFFLMIFCITVEKIWFKPIRWACHCFILDIHFENQVGHPFRNFVGWLQAFIYGTKPKKNMRISKQIIMNEEDLLIMMSIRFLRKDLRIRAL